jgi:hypothetical protein
MQLKVAQGAARRMFIGKLTSGRLPNHRTVKKEVKSQTWIDTKRNCTTRDFSRDR